MIAFTTFEQADEVDARSAVIHKNELLRLAGKKTSDYVCERLSGITEQEGLFLLPDHPYHRQAAGELGINFEEI